MHGHLNVKISPLCFKQLAYLTSDGQTNSPKYAEFYCQNKFERLVHLVGFVIRIYHDARSPERQNFTSML